MIPKNEGKINIKKRKKMLNALENNIYAKNVRKVLVIFKKKKAILFSATAGHPAGLRNKIPWHSSAENTLQLAYFQIADMTAI